MCSKCDQVQNYKSPNRSSVHLKYSSLIPLTFFRVTWRQPCWSFKPVTWDMSSSHCKFFLLLQSPNMAASHVGENRLSIKLRRHFLCFWFCLTSFSFSAKKWNRLRQACKNVNQKWGISLCVDGMGRSCSLQWTVLC